MDKTVRI